MKKLLVLALVLSMATVANAGLKLVVGGVIDPPDTSVELKMSDTAMIGVWSDGQTLANETFFISVEGFGVIDVSQAINNVVSNSSGESVLAVGDPIPGTLIFMDMTIVAVPPVPLPTGTVIDALIFHCEGGEQLPNDVLITLYSVEAGTYDTQIIHQIPEPITMTLLGLGGLFLRRRK